MRRPVRQNEHNASFASGKSEEKIEEEKEGKKGSLHHRRPGAARGGDARVLAPMGLAGRASPAATAAPLQPRAACGRAGESSEKKDDGEGVSTMQLSEQNKQDIRDVAALTGGTLAFVFLVFGFTCLPSFLVGPVHTQVVASVHAPHHRS